MGRCPQTGAVLIAAEVWLCVGHAGDVAATIEGEAQLTGARGWVAPSRNPLEDIVVEITDDPPLVLGTDVIPMRDRFRYREPDDGEPAGRS